MGEYSKAAIIKYTRKTKGMTQEELAEGICDPVTLSRYENSQLDPTDDKFARLMQRMGESGDIYSFPIQCDAIQIENTMKELQYVLQRKDWKEINRVKQILEQEYQISMEYPENQQYLGRLDIIIRVETNELNKRDAIYALEQMIQITMKDYDNGEFESRFVYSETEVLILNNIATYCGKEGEFHKANKIFQELRTYFLRTDYINDYKPRYLVHSNYSNLLGLNGRYDECIEVCQEEIRWLTKNNKANTLYVLYYNIGWIIKKKIELGLESEKRISEAKCYVWLAYQLCKKYPEDKGNLELLVEFYNELK